MQLIPIMAPLSSAPRNKTSFKRSMKKSSAEVYQPGTSILNETHLRAFVAWGVYSLRRVPSLGVRTCNFIRVTFFSIFILSSDCIIRQLFDTAEYIIMGGGKKRNIKITLSQFRSSTNSAVPVPNMKHEIHISISCHSQPQIKTEALIISMSNQKQHRDKKTSGKPIIQQHTHPDKL